MLRCQEGRARATPHGWLKADAMASTGHHLPQPPRRPPSRLYLWSVFSLLLSSGCFHHGASVLKSLSRFPLCGLQHPLNSTLSSQFLRRNPTFQGSLFVFLQTGQARFLPHAGVGAIGLPGTPSVHKFVHWTSNAGIRLKTVQLKQSRNSSRPPILSLNW